LWSCLGAGQVLAPLVCKPAVVGSSPIVSTATRRLCGSASLPDGFSARRPPATSCSLGSGRPDLGTNVAPSPTMTRDPVPPMGVTIDDARAIVADFPRSYEALVRDRVKFRVGRIVYAAFSRDETIMGFAFPREEREA